MNAFANFRIDVKEAKSFMFEFETFVWDQKMKWYEEM